MSHPDSLKALDAAVKKIESDFGKGAIMRFGDAPPVPVEAIPTGSLPLDIALGIGGIPRGRIIEIYGPESSGKTTFCYEVMAQEQKMGGICAFIDSEHAMDPIYASQVGLNMSDLYVAQPDNGEQAIEIAETLIRSGAVSLIVIDSVAALTPKAELEGEMGDMQPGMQARLMSKALRKLVGVVKQNNCTVIFTNQIRMKIGVMFGCFDYNTRVSLADGTSEKIGKIVNNKMPVEVMSMNTQTGAIEPRRVVNWFNNGTAERWLAFEVAGGPRGRMTFRCTENHVIFTPEGEVPAGDLEPGEQVLVGAESFLMSDDQEQLILGSLLGDGSLRQVSALKTSFRAGHGEAQRDYLEWKHAMLAPFARDIARTGAGYGFDTLALQQLTDLRAQAYGPEGRTVSDEMLARLDVRAVAAWYQDDGTFGGSYERWGNGKAEICAPALTRADRERVALRMEQLGLGMPTVTQRGLLWSGARTRQLQEAIAPFVHPSMDYKLHPTLRGRFTWEPDANGPSLAERASRVAVPATIVSIQERLATPRQRTRFDIEVEDNHTYLVDGVVVHNSPETTTGGNALKFYASVRMDIRRIQTVKEGGEATANRVKVKVVKNKVAPPFREAEFEIVFGEGFDNYGSLIDLALDPQVAAIEKAGAFFTMPTGDKLQGRAKAIAWLKENPAVAQELEEKIRTTLMPKRDLIVVGHESTDEVEAEIAADAPETPGEE